MSSKPGQNAEPTESWEEYQKAWLMKIKGTECLIKVGVINTAKCYQEIMEINLLGLWEAAGHLWLGEIQES